MVIENKVILSLEQRTEYSRRQIRLNRILGGAFTRHEKIADTKCPQCQHTNLKVWASGDYMGFIWCICCSLYFNSPEKYPELKDCGCDWQFLIGIDL